MFLKTRHVLTQGLLRTPVCPIFFHCLCFWDLWFCVILMDFLQRRSFVHQSENTFAYPFHSGTFPQKRKMLVMGSAWFNQQLKKSLGQSIISSSAFVKVMISSEMVMSCASPCWTIACWVSPLLFGFFGLVLFWFYFSKWCYSLCFPE